GHHYGAIGGGRALEGAGPSPVLPREALVNRERRTVQPDAEPGAAQIGDRALDARAILDGAGGRDRVDGARSLHLDRGPCLTAAVPPRRDAGAARRRDRSPPWRRSTSGCSG